MTKDEIINSNKIIASFMGYHYVTGSGWILSKYSSKDVIPAHKLKMNSNDILARHHYNLRYYNEWNWLMRVIEKIDELGYETNIFCHNNWKDPKRCIILKYDCTEISSVCGDNKINVTYEAVIEFIKWYNKQK